MWDKRCCRAVWCLAIILGSCYCIWRLSGCPGPPTPSQDVSFFPNFSPLFSSNFTMASPPYPLHTLPPGDSSTLINLKEFTFLSPLAQCNSTPLIVAVVHSAPDNVIKRRSIRSSWGNSVKLVFMVGETNSSSTASRLEEEIKKHGDVIQGSFLDSYRNLTYKHVMTLKWAAYHCSGARYILKTDDDVFVNLPKLEKFLEDKLSPLGARRLILCDVFRDNVVHRSFRSKWRVSFSEYSGRYYPPYCAGWAVIYSPDVVFKLYSEAQKTPYFWVDDVHITGTLASKINVTQTNVGHLIRSKSECQEMVDSGKLDDDFLFGLTTSSNVKKLWKLRKIGNDKNRNLKEELSTVNL